MAWILPSPILYGRARSTRRPPPALPRRCATRVRSAIMATYDPDGRIVFSKEEKEVLQARASAAGITLEQQIKLLLVRGLPVQDSSGNLYTLSVDLDLLHGQSEGRHAS